MTHRLIIAAAALVVIVAIVYAAWRRWIRRPPGYLWCHDCEVWCDERDDPCECCELELEPARPLDGAGWLRGIARVFAGVPSTIGAYDDGEPVTGELRAVDSLDDEPPEDWSPRAEWGGELDELSLEATDVRRLFVDLSDDADLIEWDARQQAARVWDIAYIEFPALRAGIAREYAAAAAESRDYFGRRLAA